MTTLENVAERLADATGLDRRDVVETLTEAVAQGRVMLADNIHVRVSAEDALHAYAHIHARAVGSLTDKERRIVVGRAILAEAERVAQRDPKVGTDAHCA